MNTEESVYPPWSEVKERWPDWVKNRPPLTFIQLVNAKENKVLLAAGLSLLGYRDDMLFAIHELVAKTHPNQQRLFRIQTEQVYRVFTEHPEWIQDKGVIYSNIRSFCDASGQFWRVHQVTTPVQYNRLGQLVCYLSYYFLLGHYHDEPFETSIFTDPAFPNEQQLLRDRLNRIKNEVLHDLGFSEREEQLIRLMNSTNGKPARIRLRDIPAIMKISPRTVAKHRLNILKKGREAFPHNSFQTAMDVVRYLARQDLV